MVSKKLLACQVDSLHLHHAFLFYQSSSAKHVVPNLHPHRTSDSTPPEMASESSALHNSHTYASPFFTQLLQDKFDRTINVHPSKLTNLLSVRQLREDGVTNFMQNIRECGWTGSPLYASDRGGNQTPVLLEGAHRIEALR